MRNGKYAAPRKRRGNAKVLVTLLALTLVLGCVAGGTIAWLTSTPDAIANTFTIGDINISLTGASGVFKTNSPNTVSTGTVTTYVPGQVIEANPRVTVEKGSEACFLFIHIVEDNNTLGNGKVIQWDLWEPSEGETSVKWIAVEGHSGYYYRKVDKLGDTPANYEIFKGSTLTVNEDLKKSDIEKMQTGGYPTITISAAAVQRDNIPNESNDEVAAAWELLPEGFKSSN